MPEYAALTDVGQRRDHNEDNHVVAPLSQGLLCAVADGMGGHAAGEVASQMAVEAVQRASKARRQGDDLLGVLADQVRDVHLRILDEAKDGREGMGCTLTAAIVEPGRALLLHIGDSRAYRVRADAIEQLTDDDSLVGELLRENLLTREQAQSHPARSVLTRALGVGDVADFHTGSAELGEGDLLLLCSDGLTTHVEDEEIVRLLADSTSLQQGAERLVAAANANGGSDNITVILARGAGA